VCAGPATHYAGCVAFDRRSGWSAHCLQAACTAPSSADACICSGPRSELSFGPIAHATDLLRACLLLRSLLAGCFVLMWVPPGDLKCNPILSYPCWCAGVQSMCSLQLHPAATPVAAWLCNRPVADFTCQDTCEVALLLLCLESLCASNHEHEWPGHASKESGLAAACRFSCTLMHPLAAANMYTSMQPDFMHSCAAEHAVMLGACCTAAAKTWGVPLDGAGEGPVPTVAAACSLL
jgi:hypothetical protein